MLKTEKSRADGRGFIIGLISNMPHVSARVKSAPITYDQLPGFHLGLVVATDGGCNGKGGGRRRGAVDGGGDGHLLVRLTALFLGMKLFLFFH